MKRKRLIAVLLCFVLLSGFVPVFASASDLTEDSALNPLTSGAFNGSAAQENVIRNLSARLGLNRNTALTEVVSDEQHETAESYRQTAGEGNLSRVSDGVRRTELKQKIKRPQGTAQDNAPSTSAAPTITSHPQSTSAAVGTRATFKVVASGSNLSYQWQYRKTASGTWTDSKGINYNKATFTPDVSSSMNGYQYRCKVSNSAGTVYSDAVTLTVTGSAPTSQNPSESGLSKTDFMQGIYKFVIEGKDFYAVNLEEFDRRAAEKRMCAATDKVDFYGSGSLDYAVFTFLYPIEDCMFFLSPVTITLGDKKNNSDVEWSALCRMADEPDSWYRMETFPFADGESAFAEMNFKEPSTILSFTVIPTRFPSGHSPFIISADTASAVVGFADFEAAKRFAESITKMS